MSSDTIVFILIGAAAVPANLFPILYGITAPWYASVIGRALMTSAVGLAALLDVAFLTQWLGTEYGLRDHVRITVIGIIAVGAWMQLGALVQTQFRKRAEKYVDRMEAEIFGAPTSFPEVKFTAAPESDREA